VKDASWPAYRDLDATLAGIERRHGNISAAWSRAEHVRREGHPVTVGRPGRRDHRRILTCTPLFRIGAGFPAYQVRGALKRACIKPGAARGGPG
jgi:hypothetical protein